MTYTIKKQIRTDTPQVGTTPYRQLHAHSTGNSNSTAQNEADYMGRKDLNTGFYTHVVGNGQVIQTAPVNRGAYDVGGSWNYETYAAVELIESHKSKDEFTKDYKIYCELLYDLAKEAGIPITLDTSDLAGIKTHNYCTYNQPNNGSDHVDPIPYLAKWGITLEQFRKDIVNSKGNNSSEDNSTITGTIINSKGDEEMKIITITTDANYYGKAFKKGACFCINGSDIRYIERPQTLTNLEKLGVPRFNMNHTDLLFIIQDLGLKLIN